MKSFELFADDTVRWVVFGRDPAKPADVIDTNEYLLISDGNGVLMDPGGTEIFPDVVSAISDYLPIEKIGAIFGSHQDPDIISSLSLWLNVCPAARVYVPGIWTGFITHFGCTASQLIAVPDQGMTLSLSTRHSLEFVPAHYLHSSGNHHLYDPHAKVLFSGDVGAALLPPGSEGLFVEDFDRHIQYMEGFHRRWMPSERARDAWIARVSRLDIDYLCPQHGAIFRRADVPRFLDWFGGLALGSALD
ncbi:MAG: MBL fold metallo-hydrolase [Gammaproteobacteria bacterium]